VTNFVENIFRLSVREVCNLQQASFINRKIKYTVQKIDSPQIIRIKQGYDVICEYEYTTVQMKFNKIHYFICTKCKDKCRFIYLHYSKDGISFKCRKCSNLYYKCSFNSNDYTGKKIKNIKTVLKLLNQETKIYKKLNEETSYMVKKRNISKLMEIESKLISNYKKIM
jgi:hypothetical protein